MAKFFNLGQEGASKKILTANLRSKIAKKIISLCFTNNIRGKPYNVHRKIFFEIPWLKSKNFQNCCVTFSLLLRLCFSKMALLKNWIFNHNWKTLFTNYWCNFSNSYLLNGGAIGYMSFRPTPFQPLQFQLFTLSTACLFDRVPFQLLANATAINSTYSFKFKVIQFFQHVRKRVK